MRGYKGFDENLCCRGKQYEVGKNHHQNGEIRLCKNGIHFCKSLNDVFGYYSKGRYCEVEASGTVIEGDNKCVTSDLFIIRELSQIEVNRGRNGYGNGDGYGDGYGDIQKILNFMEV